MRLFISLRSCFSFPLFPFFLILFFALSACSSSEESDNSGGGSPTTASTSTSDSSGSTSSGSSASGSSGSATSGSTSGSNSSSSSSASGSSSGTSTAPPPYPISISAGATHTCALLNNGDLKCWGSNGSGELGQGDTAQIADGIGASVKNSSAIDLGSGKKVTQITSALDYNCAVLDNATLKCWGKGSNGRLGQGNTSNLGDQANEMGSYIPEIDLGTGRTVVQISTGNNLACVLLDNGSVKCWGANGQGQLGQGSITILGNSANEMGDNLTAINLGSGKTVLQIAASPHGSTTTSHVCAILNDYSVKCWGYNASGQLGQGHTNNLGDGANEMGDNLPLINLGTGRTAKSIALGQDHTCAILDNGSVKCWGDNGSGKLGHENSGIGTTYNIGDAANEMGDNLIVTDLGTGRTATQLALGRTHSCALLDDGSVKCWGSNLSGQIGSEITGSLGDNVNEMGDNLAPVNLGTGRTALQITAGVNHTCAILDDNSTKCWGKNDKGQLGIGNTTTPIGKASGDMGDNLTPISF